VRVVRGALNWTRFDAPPPATPAQIAAVRAGHQAAVRTLAARRDGPEPPADLPFATGDHTMYEAFVVDRSAFVEAPIPPLPELYEAAGLEVQRSIAAERGFDWEKYRAWQDHNRLGFVYGLDDAEVDLLIVSVGATIAWLDDDDERRTIEEAIEDVDPDALPAQPELDPAMRQVLADVIAAHESPWLDQSIPALGGRTPREAAADPVGREELEHLLDGLPPSGPDDVGAMNTQRLRDALGL
jgi:hypothetical protein